MRRVVVGLAALAMLCGVHIGAGAHAQDADYPTRPIRVVVPYPAGGLVDLITRVVTERLGASLGRFFWGGRGSGAERLQPCT
jgi:tripartite-type tricarboxylate transporter receptor subunit TctC